MVIIKTVIDGDGRVIEVSSLPVGTDHGERQQTEKPDLDGGSMPVVPVYLYTPVQAEIMGNLRET